MSASRILVLGSSGSGKSTLAQALANRLKLPYVPTDGAYWTGDWQPTSAADLVEWLSGQAAEERWVIDGNFDSYRDILWKRAELAVWLDLPRSLTVARVFRRNVAWWVTGRKIWNGQRMTFARTISGLQHAFRSHHSKHRAYEKWLSDFPNIKVARIRSPTELQEWLATL